jgi:uncharacterized protein involved in exopolysaccharide biosynthesis
VTSTQLISKVIVRLLKWRWILLLAGIAFGIAGFLYSKKLPTLFTARSSFYPLTSSQDKNSTTSKVTELLGGNGGNKSLVEEANVNIEEVGKSKKTREAVVMQRLPAFENKLIADILLEEVNENVGFLGSKITKPKDEAKLAELGAELLKNMYSIKFNKNNLLEVNFTSANKNLLQPISNVLTDKIAKFYTELKIEKAKFDFEFLESKVDSFNQEIETFDARMVYNDRTTLFVKPGQKKYDLPREDLELKKMLVLQQRNNAIFNREEALLRLKKVTPIIKVLDEPTPPYLETKPSKMIYAAAGFVIGIMVVSLLLIANLLIRYVNKTVSNTIAANIEQAKDSK